MTDGWNTSEGAWAAREQTRRHMRRIMLAWFFGAGWVALTSGVVFFRFGEEIGLKNHKWAFGLLSSMPFVGTIFQLVSSYWIERTARRKLFFYGGFLVQRLIWLAFAALPVLVIRHPLAAILSAFGLLLAHSIAESVAVPAWTSWMADIVPHGVRGRYFGIRRQLGLIVSIPLSLTAGWLLSAARAGVLSWPCPTGWWSWTWAQTPFGVSTLQLCTLFFIAAALLGLLDLAMFIKVPDVFARTPGRPPALRDILGQPLRNRPFRRIMLFYWFLWLGAPGSSNFFWLYGRERLHVSEFWLQAMFVVAPSLGMILFARLWGRLIDRFGQKTPWVMAVIVPAVTPLCWIPLTPQTWQLGMLLALVSGIAWNAIDQTNFNSLLRFTSAAGSSPGYQAVWALASSSAGFLSGLLFSGIAWFTRPGGALEDLLGRSLEFSVGAFRFSYFHVIFLMASLLRLTGYGLLLVGVHEDNRPPVRKAVHYIFSNIYDTIHIALEFPLRLFGIGHGPQAGREEDEQVN